MTRSQATPASSQIIWLEQRVQQLTAERDAALAVLREAKKVLLKVRYRSIRDEPVDEAIATINKVLGEG